MATADFNAIGVTRQQCQGDADVLGIAEQAVRVVHAERHADQRGDRRQGDVTLVEGELQAQHFLALPHALADDAEVGNRGRIGTGERAGQAEAGHFLADGQTRQVVILLGLRAVVVEQFTRAQRVGHTDGGADHAGNRGQLLDHLVVRQRAETQATVFLRNDHAEELVLLDELPHVRRQVRMHMGDLEIVDHPAQLFHRAVQESLFVRGELRLGIVEQDVPVRITGEQLTLEANRTGFQCDALGLGQRRQHLAEHAHERRGDQRLAQERQQHRHADQREDGGRHDDRGLVDAGEPAHGQQRRADQGPDDEPHAVVGNESTYQQQGQEGNDNAH
ncbi:hypothetical protein D3C81_1202340 [compost metagenome]